MARAKSSVLTEQQEAFVEAKLDGLSDRKAAKAANFNSGAITKLSHNPTVKERIAQGKAELSAALMITRADIVEGMVGAIERAKLQSEPATEIRGWVEVSKILGLDKPETKRKELSEAARDLQHQLMNMSTNELLEMAAGNFKTYEGEAERVDE